jgi:hypothetical protein
VWVGHKSSKNASRLEAKESLACLRFSGNRYFLAFWKRTDVVTESILIALTGSSA